MNVLFVTDYVCPFCIVAKEALIRAAAETGIPVEIHTQPYELTAEDKPQVDTYHDPIRREHYKVLEEPARALGMNLHFPPAVIPRPYTHNAFMGFYYAKEFGREEEYSDACALAYFRDEIDIGSLDELGRIAAAAGLDEADFKEAVQSRKYSDLLDQQVMYDRTVLNVAHVPTIFIDDQEVSFEDYTVDAFINVLKQKSSSRSAGGCDENGCSWNPGH